MLVPKLLVLLVGLSLCIFGFGIVFHKKYHLINGYTPGPAGDRRARNMGIVQLIGGIAFLAGGTVMFFVPVRVVFILLGALLAALIIALSAAARS